MNNRTSKNQPASDMLAGGIGRLRIPLIILALIGGIFLTTIGPHAPDAPRALPPVRTPAAHTSEYGKNDRLSALISACGDSLGGPATARAVLQHRSFACQAEIERGTAQ